MLCAKARLTDCVFSGIKRSRDTTKGDRAPSIHAVSKSVFSTDNKNYEHKN